MTEQTLQETITTKAFYKTESIWKVNNDPKDFGHADI